MVNLPIWVLLLRLGSQIFQKVKQLFALGKKREFILYILKSSKYFSYFVVSFTSACDDLCRQAQQTEIDKWTRIRNEKFAYLSGQNFPQIYMIPKTNPFIKSFNLNG